MSIYIRNCPKCNVEITYSKKIRLEKANLKKSFCKKCNKERVWTRNCPKCNKLLTYDTIAHCNQCKNSLCRSCVAKQRTGEKNSFFGKKHSFETIEKIKSNLPSPKSIETIKKLSIAFSGSNNPMFGRSLYDVWAERYGKDEADLKFNQLREKRSERVLGENNPMFGKPSPQGSGNGWSGWYKDKTFFRSIRELSYIVLFLEKSNVNWTTAESIKVPYTDWKGNLRTYHPDFKYDYYLIEIKPKKLHLSPSVVLKSEAAKKYCEANNMVYQLIDPPILETNDVLNLRNLKEIKFTKRYEEKFVNLYGEI